MRVLDVLCKLMSINVHKEILAFRSATEHTIG